MTKKSKIILSIAGAAIVVLALLWYYQQQGLLKIFPTGEEMRIKKILTIDRSKFVSPQDLPPEQFEAQIKKLEGQRQAILTNPESAAAWFDFGHTKEFLNDHRGAAEAWEEAFRLQPLNFVTAANLGNVYQYFLKDYQKAENYYNKALDVKPDYTIAYDGLVDLYRYNWKEKSALLEPLLLQAARNDSANQAAYYYSLVEIFAGAGNWDKARQYLEDVGKLQPDKAQELIDAYQGLKQ